MTVFCAKQTAGVDRVKLRALAAFLDTWDPDVDFEAPGEARPPWIGQGRGRMACGRNGARGVRGLRHCPGARAPCPAAGGGCARRPPPRRAAVRRGRGEGGGAQAPRAAPSQRARPYRAGTEPRRNAGLPWAGGLAPSSCRGMRGKRRQSSRVRRSSAAWDGRSSRDRAPPRAGRISARLVVPDSEIEGRV